MERVGAEQQLKEKCPDFDLLDSFLNDREGDENTTCGLKERGMSTRTRGLER